MSDDESRHLKHVAVRPRRLFVSGGSRLSPGAALLWEELGRMLAAEDGLVVVTGGLQSRQDDPDSQTADWCVVRGVLGGLAAAGRTEEDAIETVLPDVDWNVLRRFLKGRVVMLRNRTAQARRFFMVSSADVVVSIEGENGTRSVLDLGAALEKPMLPLPFGRGASRNRWKELQDEIVRGFTIPPATLTEWRDLDLEGLDTARIRELAGAVRHVLLSGFVRNCFVMMPFDGTFDRIYDEAIRPALVAHKLNPVRTDRLGLTGSVVDTIRHALDHCYLAVADTTGDNPNVMYELGMAHATRKPVILLRRRSVASETMRVPFDIQGEYILPYDDDLEALRGRLEAMIGVSLGKLRTLDRPLEPS